MATAPNFVADKEDNDPKNEPIGVLTALTITTSFKFFCELYNLFCTSDTLNFIKLLILFFETN